MLIIIILFFAGIAALFFFIFRHVWRSIEHERWNNRQPLISTSAQLISKRTMVGGGGQDIPASTSYFATFETSDRERRELAVSGNDYGLLAEGDQGILTSQGTRYKGFERQSAAQRWLAR